MAPIRYLYTNSDLRVAPPPSLPFDDSDSWWAGVQRCFVAIPIAGTLAAVALSASLAWGYQQRTEDIVPQPAAVVEESEWQVYTPPYLAARPLYLPDPEGLPAGSLFGQPDEDFWRVYTPPYPPVRFLYLPDPEELPGGALRGQPDEDFWQVYTPPYLPPRFVYLPDPEELPAGSLFGVPEEQDWPVIPPPPSPVRIRVWAVDDEIILQPVVFVPDEDAWLPPVPQTTWRALPLWAVDEEIVPFVPPPLTVDEAYWEVYTPRPLPPQVGAFIADEEIAPPSHEDYWQVYTPAYPAPRFLYLPEPEEIPAGLLVVVRLGDVLVATADFLDSARTVASLVGVRTVEFLGKSRTVASLVGVRTAEFLGKSRTVEKL